MSEGLSIPEKIAKIADEIESAVTMSNTVTGRSDTTLFGALTALVSGFSGDLPVYMATGTADFSSAASPLEISHGSGRIPRCLIAFPESGTSVSGGEILFVYLCYDGEYEQTDYADRVLTGENARYRYCAESTVGGCAYKDANGILKTATLLVPEVAAKTEDGVDFMKSANRFTAFLPKERAGKYAKAVYRWIVFADKA